MLPLKLQKGLFIGDFPLSQPFGNAHFDTDAVGNILNPYIKYSIEGHNGLDYALPTGTPLISCITGVVIECAYDANGYGNYLKIENDRCGVIYAHMKRLSDYKPGMKVAVGANIGLSGNTGNSTGPHLHFGVFSKPRDRSNGYSGYFDPLDKNNVVWVDDIGEKPESEAITECEEILEGVRTSRDFWKKDSKDTHKLLVKEKKVTTILLNQQVLRNSEIRDLKADLGRFNEDVIDFSFRRKRYQILITPVEEVPKGGVVDE